ncbi:MAG TPA: protein kinase [Blastocatellia bacterium]|nr:protein kinase [Blastocatellia bacterium]
MTLTPNTRLGPYEILAPLGAGGMGEVYRARDTRLDRVVAIKVLPDHLASHPEQRQRFEREARAVSSLNHPHICTLHDVGHQDGLDYLVMELIEGESLADRLKKGPLPLEHALRYSIQIADALDKAHRAGIIHRDLKPGNIMLTKSGAKVLDFGLAKLLTTESEKGRTALSELPTELPSLTEEGSIIGTLQYMAPEQLEGLNADSRTDIFAFGAVVYEMATGRRAFTGKSQASIIGAILRVDPPPISAIQPLTPPELDRVVKTCLAKDPDDRWQTAHDVELALQWIAEGGSKAEAAAPVSTRSKLSHKAAGPLLGLILGVIAASAGYFFLFGRAQREATGISQPKRLTVRLPDSEPLALTGFTPLAIGRVAIAISPDGSNLVYVAIHNGAAQLYLRPLDRFEAKPISGTEGAYNPFFSPDGKWVAFFADNKLKKVSLSGGEPATLCEARNPVGANWGPNDTIFFGDQEGGVLRRISAKGGSPQIVPVSDQITEVHLLPDGKRLLYSVNVSSNPDYAQIKVLSLDTGERSIVLEGGSNPHYLPGGHLVFTRAGSLMAAPFDLETQKVTGPAVAIVEGIRGETYGSAQVSVSMEGTVVYVPGSSGWVGKPVWVDRQGKVTPTTMPTQCYGGFNLSPDGKRLAIGVAGAKDDIWIYDFERGTFLRLTVDGHNIGPVWSPDGKRVAYSSARDAQRSICWKAADGSGAEVRLTTTENGQGPESWSPDGKMLSMIEWNANDAGDIWILPVEGDHTPQPFLRTRFSEFFSSFSPNGSWITYTSDESGRYEVYVRPYPGPGGQWQISTEGGEEPVWSSNGQELFYRNGEKWMVATVRTKPDFSADPPRVMFEAYFINVPGISHYVAPDGQRQLMIKAADQDPAPKQLNVVLNLFDELKRRVPTEKN